MSQRCASDRRFDLRERAPGNAGIFISYRRQDDRSFAGRLYDNLKLHYRTDQLFMDVDSIEFGLDFHQVVERRIAQSAVMLVVIGRDWLGMRDGSGRRRLENPDDFVRLEVEAALRSPAMRVIPILVENVAPPAAEDLPAGLESLARRHALSISHEGFGADLDRLLRTLAEIVPRQR